MSKKRKALQSEHPLVLFDEKSELAEMPSIVQELSGVMQMFNGLTRRKAYLHFVEGPGCFPYPDNGDIHFVVGATHPGAYSDISRSHVCGIRVHETGRYIRLYGATRGVGFVVKDDKGSEIAQVVGSTVYLFVPNPEKLTFLFSGTEGRDLYSRIIDASWAAMAGGKEPKAVPINSLRSYRRRTANSFKTMESILGLHLASLDVKIKEATERLRALYVEKETYVRMQAFHKARREEDVREFPKRDWNRMRKHPLVERMLWVDDAVHVHTGPIVFEHDGRRFDLGRFIIRMEAGYTPSVWAIDHKHPARAMHPHISKTGITCFGNISAALAQAAGEGRAADTLDLMLSWLQDGYDPNLADTKIEEWPALEEEQPAQEKAA